MAISRLERHLRLGPMTIDMAILQSEAWVHLMLTAAVCSAHHIPSSCCQIVCIKQDRQGNTAVGDLGILGVDSSSVFGPIYILILQ